MDQNNIINNFFSEDIKIDEEMESDDTEEDIMELEQ